MPNKPTLIIHNRTRELRLAAGLTQEALALKAGLIQNTLSRLERTQSAETVPLGTVLRVAIALGVSVEKLFNATLSEEPKDVDLVGGVPDRS